MNKYYLRHRVQVSTFSGHLKPVRDGLFYYGLTFALHILLLTKPQPILRPVYAYFVILLSQKITNDLLSLPSSFYALLRCFRHRLYPWDIGNLTKHASCFIPVLL
jgi:hypothetical protein